MRHKLVLSLFPAALILTIAGAAHEASPAVPGASASEPSPSGVAQSACADCHIANAETAPAPGHFRDWELSDHGVNNVGCEACHGGDATTFDSFRAHRDVLGASDPASPVRPRNVPSTCGQCHTGPFLAFRAGPHYALLQEGVRNAPNCARCHGSVGARLHSPRSLEAECAACHGENGTAPRPDAPRQARLMLQGIMHVRTLLDQAQPLILRVDDAPRRQELEDAFRQAEVPLIEAIEGAHRIAGLGDSERLDVAQIRAETLLEELVNPERQR